jgi:hypothetical protein
MPGMCFFTDLEIDRMSGKSVRGNMNYRLQWSTWWSNIHSKPLTQELRRVYNKSIVVFAAGLKTTISGPDRVARWMRPTTVRARTSYKKGRTTT